MPKTIPMVSGAVLILAFCANNPIAGQESNQAKLIDHEIIRREPTGSAKVVYAVIVKLVDSRLPTKEELAAISNYLRTRDRLFERVFVQFYLPKMSAEAPCFAVAHHTPEPNEVQIFTERIPKELTTLLGGGKTSNKPTQYETILEAVEKTREFSQEDGTVRMRNSDGVPHVEVSPTLFRGDFEDVIAKEMKRSVVHVVLTAFIHTQCDAVRVTAIRCYFDVKSRTRSFDKSKSLTVEIGRADALAILKRNTGINDFHELCGVLWNGAYLPDQPTEMMLRCLFDDQGPPTRSRMYSDFANAPKPRLFKHWTDNLGKFTSEAEFLGAGNGKVSLRKKDGTTISVPLDKLSSEDQEWIATKIRKGRP